MADQNDNNPNEPVLQAQDMPITVHAQYIRDLSFENPHAPDALRASAGAPEINVNIGMDARDLEDKNTKNLYEVALNIQATAKRGDDTIFIAELIYGITVEIGESVPEEQHHPLLLIEIPRLAFPFARQIIATLTSQGGFPPLLVNPVDFHALYLERFKNEIEESQKQSQKA